MVCVTGNMSDHSIYLRVSGRLYTRDYSGAAAWALNATPLPMWGLEGPSMVPSVTSVHVTVCDGFRKIQRPYNEVLVR
jgi:hypothetical protein